jgi:hypothetical protein
MRKREEEPLIWVQIMCWTEAVWIGPRGTAQDDGKTRCGRGGGQCGQGNHRKEHAGKLKPVIDRVMPLSQGIEAYRIMERGEQFGKIVLTP